MTFIGASCRRLCLAADAVGYGSRDDYLQQDTQQYLIEALDSAAASAGLHRATWDRQPGGDGELAVLPQDEPESDLVDGFIRQLDVVLTRRNRVLRADAQLRLRIAVRFGRLMPGGNGFAGPGPVEVSRMLNSAPLREAIVAAPAANLAVLVSENIYHDTIEPLHTTLRPEWFREVRVAEKEFKANGWLWVPGYAAHDLFLPSQSEL